MAAFREDFLSGDDFEAVLAIACFYDYRANASNSDFKMAKSFRFQDSDGSTDKYGSGDCE